MNTIRMAVWFWIKNLMLSLDQLLNVMLWGDPDETLSRRAGRARDTQRKWGCILCKMLDWVDDRHCQKSIDRIGTIEGEHSVPGMLRQWRIENQVSHRAN